MTEIAFVLVVGFVFAVFVGFGAFVTRMGAQARKPEAEYETAHARIFLVRVEGLAHSLAVIATTRENAERIARRQARRHLEPGTSDHWGGRER